MDIVSMYFSPTATTEKVVDGLKKSLSSRINFENNVSINFTSPSERETYHCFSENEIVILGLPVYAGRVPNILLKYLDGIKGNGALGIPVVLYGNRNYDDGLIELHDIMEKNGFRILGAGAFVGEHSFSRILAAGRPDDDDFDDIEAFSIKIEERIRKGNFDKKIDVNGNRPYRPYYRPKNPMGEPVDIRKVTPKTKDSCINCKICVSACPMGSIDFENPSVLNGICIKCGACEKKCPVGAKYYDDENYLRHKSELEIEFSKRRAAEIFV